VFTKAKFFSRCRSCCVPHATRRWVYENAIGGKSTVAPGNMYCIREGIVYAIRANSWPNSLFSFGFLDNF